MRSLIFIFISFSAGATEVQVLQAGQMFLSQAADGQTEQIKNHPDEGKSLQLQRVQIKVGDSLLFKNNDKITHNVYGEDFDLKAQKPGEERAQTFSKPGTFHLRCAIHPKMKLDVEVSK